MFNFLKQAFYVGKFHDPDPVTRLNGSNTGFLRSPSP